jgi:hypothetical protein
MGRVILPILLGINMGETKESSEFVKLQKEKYGKSLFIEKVIRPDLKGQPDIFLIYKGMPLYAEAKLINSITNKNLYPFKELQLDILTDRALSGAMSIGVLYNEKEFRYIMYDQLTEFVDWNNGLDFNLELIREKWIKEIK